MATLEPQMPAEPVVESDPAAAERASIRKWLEGEFKNRFRVALALAILGGIALGLGILLWMTVPATGHATKTTTTVVEKGQQQSSTTVETQGDPLYGLPAGLIILGVGLVVPLATWAMAPGAKFSPTSVEGGTVPDVGMAPREAARGVVAASLNSTHREVEEMQQAAVQPEAVAAAATPKTRTRGPLAKLRSRA